MLNNGKHLKMKRSSGQTNETLHYRIKRKDEKSRKSVDSLYAMKIDSLETKNQAMNLRVQAKKRIKTGKHSKWNLKHDMDELGKVPLTTSA